MHRILGINFDTNPAMPVMPDVLCLFPAINPSRFALPASRKTVPCYNVEVFYSEGKHIIVLKSEGGSTSGGINSTGGTMLTQLADGNYLLTLPDGTEIYFFPKGAFNPELSGYGNQFEDIPGYYGQLAFTGGQYKLTDKDGTVTEFEKLGGSFKPRFRRDRTGNTLSYTYNGSGALAKIADDYGRYIDVSYDAFGKVTSVGDSAGRSASLGYTDGRLTGVTDIDGAQTGYSYDGQGRMTGIAYANGAHKTISYDALNRATSVTEDNGNNAQSFDYNEPSSHTVITDALGRRTTYYYAAVDGRTEITKIVDAAGGETKYTFDDDLNRTAVTDVLGRTTSMVYDGNGNMISVKDPAGNMTQMAYDPTYNQVTSVADPKYNITGMTYDASGNLIKVRDAAGNTSEMSYDARGHVTGTKDALGNVSLFKYDSYGDLSEVTDPLNRTTILTRDNLHLGRVIRTEDPKHKLTLFDYDVMGNLTKVTDAIGGITQYGYTGGGCTSCGGAGDLLASVRDAKNQTTSFAYDFQKRLTGVTNPAGNTKTFEYNRKGYPTRVTDAKGQVITLEYDANDRVAVMRLPEGAVTYAYDAVGNPLSVTDPGSPTPSLEYTYDAANRVTQTKQTVGGVIYTINYTYDVNGNRTQMTTPWGNYNYTYDALNRLINLTNSDAKTVTFAYDAAGKRTRMTYPNGTETTYAYDKGSQLTQILHRKATTALAFADYVYDLAGNRISMADIFGTHSYAYDDLHRLTSASHPPGSSLPLDGGGEIFSYDAVGNRTSDAVMTGYLYDNANRLLNNSSYTYTHDANGNLTDKYERVTNAHTVYAYNSENQKTSATMPDGTVVTYKYDPRGRRIEKSVQPPSPALPYAMRYVYDTEDVIAILDGNNNIISNFTHGPGIDEPLIMKKADGTNYFYHADGLGSITALTDETGTIVETIEYQAYGKPVFKNASGTIIPVSALGNPYSYTSREYDNETGLFYYRARYYSAEIGRFIQEDPVNIYGGLNYYRYAWDNPIRLSDPLGLKPVTSANCEALIRLIGKEKDGFFKTKRLKKLNVLFSGSYNSLSIGDISGLNAAFDTIYGPVDADWMLRSVLFGVGAIPGGAIATYFGGKMFWNEVVNLGSLATGGSGQSIFINILAMDHINAPFVGTWWLWSTKTLEEIFAPALEKCLSCSGEE